ncbi:MAG: radical SAM protein, partial [Clostridia bacterium]|nr:radical SAM protein [Clostridia bacterium]
MSSKCNLCPRNCGVDRRIQKGYCKAPFNITVARSSLHFWEEPCISGVEGSGTVFFSGCSMGCVYCQNFDIA